MKTFSYLPLYPYYVKYAGLLISGTGLVLIFLAGTDYELLLYAGLILMVFSGERTETDLTQSIRAESFKTTFGLLISFSMGLYLTSLISGNFEFQWTPFLTIGLPLLFYLLIFNLSLIFRIRINSNKLIGENIRNQRRLYIITVCIILVISSLLVLDVCQ